MMIKHLLAAAALVLAGMAAVGAPASADPYVSLGDSTSTSALHGDHSSYVDLLNDEFATTLGVDEHIALAQSGQVLGGLKAQQLPAALAAIDGPSDTKAVTIAIGANDALGGIEGCFGQPGGCEAYQASYDDMVAQVRAALDEDPGEEFFGLLSYYNPYRWDGSGVSQQDQDNIDLQLFGANGTPDQCAVETSTGLNDIVYQAGSRYGAVVADPYDAFLAADGAFLRDPIHANAQGDQALAAAFLDPVQPIDCDPPEEPTCETDPSLCPEEPTCETDPSLCPVEPTCETDASLCPDRVAPQTRITAKPARRAHRRAVTFRFRSSEPGTFRCSIDRKPFRRCSSPFKARLRPGAHRFRVRAIDRAGNVDRTPAAYRFRIR